MTAIFSYHNFIIGIVLLFCSYATYTDLKYSKIRNTCSYGLIYAGIIVQMMFLQTLKSLSFVYDAAKKVKGRKRYILVDTMGLFRAVIVHPANIQDRDGVKLLCKENQTLLQPSSIDLACLPPFIPPLGLRDKGGKVACREKLNLKAESKGRF